MVYTAFVPAASTTAPPQPPAQPLTAPHLAVHSTPGLGPSLPWRCVFHSPHQTFLETPKPCLPLLTSSCAKPPVPTARSTLTAPCTGLRRSGKPTQGSWDAGFPIKAILGPCHQFKSPVGGIHGMIRCPHHSLLAPLNLTTSLFPPQAPTLNPKVKKRA